MARWLEQALRDIVERAMQRPRIDKLFLVLALMIHQMSALAGADMVLCVGSDGHVAVEPAHLTCNQFGSSPSASTPTQAQAPALQSGRGCSDVLLSSQALGLVTPKDGIEKSSKTLFPQLVFLAFARPNPGRQGHFRVATASSFPRFDDRSLACLRTVVLLV